MRRLFRSLSPDEGQSSQPLPGLRPGVILLGEGEETELRDMQLGQVVKLGEAASLIVQLLDGSRTADELLRDASKSLGEEVNPLGLVELLQALDRRALLDTPRARMVATQGLVRADIASLNRLAARARSLEAFIPEDDPDDIAVRMTPNASFTCHSCTRCCSERNTLGPIDRDERDRILEAFSLKGQTGDADVSNFLPIPRGESSVSYHLRTRGGFCAYLNKDGMCRIHEDLGEELKPAVCRSFPFLPTRTPEGWDVGLSLSCPTVAAGGGSDPTEQATRVLVQLGSRLPEARQTVETVPLTATVSVPYSDYRNWEESSLE
ncbi:MAG: YkgJ family cysteine cluster protein, partial [Myxococcota bacterium]|nr:YkgJ family cysteine cluster protein [Myxococcota bacterium]